MDISAEQKKQIDDANEITLYFIIDECGAFIWRMNHDMIHGRIEQEHAAIDKDIVQMRELQNYAVSQLGKFGVEKSIEEFPDGKKRATPEYWAWYRWWDSWKKNMIDEQWDEIQEKMRNKEDISSYRPESDWRLTLKEVEKQNA